jgi:hypothetical protein
LSSTLCTSRILKHPFISQPLCLGGPFLSPHDCRCHPAVIKPQFCLGYLSL